MTTEKFSSAPVLSIASPVYNAESIIDELVDRVIAAVPAGCSFEIVLVDDRSEDGSWSRIVSLSARDSRVRGVRLSRNVGQHRAIRAALDAARGDYVVVMDCDLQDDPSYIPAMLERARDGFDIVYTRKRRRRHSRLRNLAARVYFAVYNFLIADKAGVAQAGVGAYSLLSRKVVDEYRRIPDMHAHYLSNLRSLGFEHSFIEIDHHERYAGKSSYTFGKLVRHGVNGVVSQSVRLLSLSVGLGISFCCVAFVGVVVLVVGYFVRGALPGYTSIAVLLLLFTGLIMLSVGIAGIYIGRIFEQVKGRPMYVVDTETADAP